MLFSTIALAVLAGQVVVTEGIKRPYKPELARMSVKHMFLSRRAEDDGYQPDTSLCGTGNSCAEACGAGFAQCASSDDQIHCYDAGSSQTCCPNNSGDSCDAGYYCSADTTGETYCCPNESSLEECAAVFSVTGTLSAQLPVATGSLSTLSGTTTTTLTSTSTITSTVAKSTSSTTEPCTTYTTGIVIPIPVSETTGYNTTTIRSTNVLPTSSTPATTTAPFQAGAHSVQAPGLVAVAVFAFAALL